MAEIIYLDNTSERLDELNGAMAQFAQQVRISLQRKLLTLGLRERLALSKSISKLKKIKTSGGDTALVEEKILIDSIIGRLYRKGGEVIGPSWSFERHGIFLERGVGKGRPVGSASAKAASRPWLNPVLDLQLNILSDILEERYADIVAGQLRILIPGVIDRTVVTK